MAHTEESISKELSRIVSSIPENLKKNVVTNVPLTPTIKMVMEKALTLDSISAEKKEKIKTLIETGEFDKVKPVENAKIAKMIDNYVGRQINQSIKSGKLPSKSELKKMPHFKKYLNE